MAQTDRIGWLGFLLRFLAALVLVFATYNPEGYSYFDWLLAKASGDWPLKTLAGIVLLIGWTVYLRATLRSLGGFGIFLTIAFFAALLWLLTDWGVIPRDSVRAMTYLVEVVISALLATGMIWSHVRRRLSGQMDVDEIEDN